VVALLGAPPFLGFGAGGRGAAGRVRRRAHRHRGVKGADTHSGATGLPGRA